MKDIPVKYFFYGKWKAKVDFPYPNTKKEPYGCMIVYADTLPAWLKRISNESFI